MPALITDAKVRYEHPVEIDVVAGVISITDQDDSKTFTEGDHYESPEAGGCEVKCIESAFYTAQKPVDDKLEKNDNSKVDKQVPDIKKRKVEVKPKRQPQAPVSQPKPKAKSKGKK